MTTLERKGVSGMQGLKKNQLDYYLNLMRDRQRKAYDLVKEQDQITKAKHEENNDSLKSIVGKRPKFEEGDWVLVSDEMSLFHVGGNMCPSRKRIVGAEKSRLL